MATTSRSSWVVSLYEVDQRYGGPEEGGWWFDTYRHLRTVRSFRSEAVAIAFARRLNHWLAIRNEALDVRLTSVAYAGGHVEALLHENCPPAYLPAERPIYC